VTHILIGARETERKGETAAIPRPCARIDRAE
jgi:hypothetical protein